jgi:hypothetical protein
MKKELISFKNKKIAINFHSEAQFNKIMEHHPFKFKFNEWMRPKWTEGSKWESVVMMDKSEWGTISETFGYTIIDYSDFTRLIDDDK